jgi:hypothetical protein
VLWIVANHNNRPMDFLPQNLPLRLFDDAPVFRWD